MRDQHADSLPTDHRSSPVRWALQAAEVGHSGCDDGERSGRVPGLLSEEVVLLICVVERQPPFVSSSNPRAEDCAHHCTPGPRQ